MIPILNIYGTGSRLQKKLPELLVTDGCIYVSANIEGPGVLVQHGKILRVVFGVREKSEFREELKEIAKDFSDSGISGELSEKHPPGCAGEILLRLSDRDSRSLLSCDGGRFPERGRGARDIQGDDSRDHGVGGRDGRPV